MTKENSGMTCIKYMLFTTNFLFFMIGFLLISIGLVVKSVYHDFDRFLLTQYYTPSNLVIAVGVLIFFVAFLGFIGAILESTFIVNLYALALALVFILQLSAAIVAFTQMNIFHKISESVEGNLEAALLNYRDGPFYTYDRNAVDFIQSRLECCGIYSYKDWKRNHWNFASNCSSNILYSPDRLESTNLTITIPDSCFVGEECKAFYPNGCLDALDDMLSKCALLLGCGAICVAFVQLLGVIFARLLASSIRNLKTQELVRDQQRRDRLYQDLHTPEIRTQPKTYVSVGIPEQNSDSTA